MQIITSKSNDQVKNIKKLYQKKYRDENQEFIIEGIKILKEAIQENAIIKTVYIEESKFEEITKEIPSINNLNIVLVSSQVLQEISDVKTPQGVIAIVGKQANYNISYDEEVSLILDDIQDPGNIGTIIRTADSLNMKQIIVSENTADIFSPKVVRSTMGAIFRVNVKYVNSLAETISDMKNHGKNVYVTDLNTDSSIYNVDYKNSVIVIGNEANGVSKEVKESATKKIKIPMLGKTESLNAAVATSVILYEAYRTLGKIK